jgi:transposase InsO family protein
MNVIPLSLGDAAAGEPTLCRWTLGTRGLYVRTPGLTFADLGEARTKIGLWRIDYNEVGPHSALGNRTPTEYAKSGVLSS